MNPQLNGKILIMSTELNLATNCPINLSTKTFLAINHDVHPEASVNYLIASSSINTYIAT